MKKTKNTSKIILILLIIVAFIAGIFAVLLGFYVFGNDRDESSDVSNFMQRFHGDEVLMVDVVRDVMPAVVSVEVSSPASVKNKKDVIGGTGFIFDKTGLVLTNKHLVKRADKSADYEITFYNGFKYSAVLVDEDLFDDVAVIKIVTDEPKSDFPVVRLGDSDYLEIGQKVMVIGNALVTYDHSVSAGIISAVNRNVSAYYYDFKGPSENLGGLIQTDAAINLGNSGGPLVNLNGEVIGMVTAFEENACGIGFAIPINDLKLAMNSVKKSGEIIRAALGVRVIMLSKDDAAKIDPELTYGALIVGDKAQMKDAVLKKSNAYKAGLREGDVLFGLDDTMLDLEHPLNKVIANYSPGDTVKLGFWRDGEDKFVNVVLNSSKDFE
jgi:S1-C subfamily serine protease